MKWLREWTVLCIAVGGIFVGSCLCSGCSRTGEQAPDDQRVIPVEVVCVERETLKETASLTAILEAVRAVDVVAEVTGTLQALHRDVGDRVTEKTILATLEKEIHRENLRQAEAALSAARARHRVAVSDNLRDSTLFAVGDVAEAILETSRMARQIAGADVEAATAVRQLAARELRETDIRTPFSSYISRRWAEIGAFVTPGTPLFRVVDIDSLKLLLGVSQRNFARIRPGMEVSVATEVFEEKTFRGVVRRVSPEADENTHTFAVEVILPNPADHPLKDGMVVQATITLDVLPDVIAIPREALLLRRGQEMVFVIEDSVAYLREVRSGRLVENRYVIETGLVAGDRLVHVGADNLRDSSRVTVEAELLVGRKGQAS